MNIHFVRHGETEANATKQIQGQYDGQLSERGKEQARLVAERPKGVTFDHIYTSDLSRAHNTALEIARYHSVVPFTVLKQLRERNMGEFEGSPSEVFYQAFEVAQAKNGDDSILDSYCPRGGESLLDVKLRSDFFL